MGSNRPLVPSRARTQPGRQQRVFGRLAGGGQPGPYVSLTVERLGDQTGDMEKFSLEARSRVLMRSAATAPAGRAAETVYGGHEHVLRQTLIALTAGAVLSEHENPGEATVQVLGGRGTARCRRHRVGGTRRRPPDRSPSAAHVACTRRLGGSAHRRQTPVGVGQRLSSRCAIPCPSAPTRSPRYGHDNL